MNRTNRNLCALVLSVLLTIAGALGPHEEFSAKAAPKETPRQKAVEKCDTTALECQKRGSERGRPGVGFDNKVKPSPAGKSPAVSRLW